MALDETKRKNDGPMIEAPVRTEAIARAYDLYSIFYEKLISPLEVGPRMRGLELAAIQPREDILEVAVGPGVTLVEILKRVDRDKIVHGLDLSLKMLEKAEKRATKAGFSNFVLRKADARSLPFEDETFDVLLCSYMMDLLPLEDMPTVLGEFGRVLRDGGRLVLVNMSKDKKTTILEKLYRVTPDRLLPYLYGGCRPVLMAGPLRDQGFLEVRREFIAGPISSEVVVAKK